MTDHSKPMNERSELTLQRLEAALQRLLSGQPERTPNDGEIYISRINKEAGLSDGAIYYYKAFVEKARRCVDSLKRENTNRPISNKISLQQIRKQRDEEKRLKEKYRAQRDEIKMFCDQVVAKNANLEFSLFEALERIQRLEDEIKAVKVVGINQGRQQ
jgi:hypothetical protein